MTRFVLYSRSYCHLCDDMLHALQRFADEFSFTLEVVDIDADERLVEQYDELVPVLIGFRGTQMEAADGVELCHYFLDEARVGVFLRGV